MMVLHPNTEQQPQQQPNSNANTTAANRRALALRLRKAKGNSASAMTNAKNTTNNNNPLSSPDTRQKANSSNATSPARDNNNPPKECPYAKLAALCAQNAIRMGARTQLNLCPPGRAKRALQTSLRQQPPQQIYPIIGGLEKLTDTRGYDEAEQDYLNQFHGVSEEEDESSGDEEDLRDDIFDPSVEVDSDDYLLRKYTQLREPLTSTLPVVPEPTSPSNAAGNNNPVVMRSLPFNWRKLRFFDCVSASDSTVARTYLEDQVSLSKRRSTLALLQRLRRAQTDSGATADERNLDMTPLDTPMTPSLAAALVLESLSINRLESLEGMSKCYDGIVAAGMAILESSSSLLQTPSRSSPSRSEILSVLAPLLVTSLEQPSGDAILLLATLRRMCGTFRYQRRFVQRVAPLLVRPPRGAPWCLQHQNDMEAILAATELILDSANSIFSSGWHERGRLLLADSQRVKTLDSAAKQLRSFSQEPSAEGSASSLGLSLHGSSKYASKKRKDNPSTSSSSPLASEPLAEWEVVAVVDQIKTSISGAMKTDWAKAAAQAESSRPVRRRRGVLQQSSSVSLDGSIGSVPNSPRSPGRTLATFGRISPHSPPPMNSVASDFSSSSADTAIGTAFSDRAASPPPAPPAAPTSPPTPHRTTSDRGDSVSPTTFTTTQPPPRSPTSPRRDLRQPDTGSTGAPLSPRRGRVASGREGISPNPSPLSPSTSSVGTSGSHEMVTYRPSSSSANMSSGAASPASYRLLTSSSAERKRTVLACRVLRAQIQRYEEAFIQLHGHPPKGNAERAPLATTYAQYREWKRAIRADAACRIQALIRGARTRSILLRRGSPRLSRVIMKRPGKPGYVGSESLMNQISIPVEISESDTAPSTQSQGSSSPFSQGSNGPALAPHWASAIRRRPSGGDRSPGDNLLGTSPARRSLPGLPTGSSSSAIFADFTMEELQVQKRELKKQLKSYDIRFAQTHGRMPVKAEKEPIRDLYEKYNALKSQISTLESEGRSEAAATSLLSIPRNDSPSPSVGSDSGSHESPGRGSGLPSAKASRRRGSAQSSRSTRSMELQDLRTEKSQLHQILRTYEREFYEQNRRQVSSFSDIRPVADKYRRYKEIKKLIASLQQQPETER